jgi:UDP-glucose 4-epimerase
LGSEVARQATAAGFEVRGAGRRPSALADYRSFDVLDGAALSAAVQGREVVIHAAGRAHVFGGRPSREPFRLTNEEGTAAVARAAVAAGVRHLVLTSSVAVYGPGPGPPRTEASSCQPEGSYAESKYAGERRASSIVAGTDTVLTILRMATIYGEGDPGNVYRLIRAIDRRRFIWVGNGENAKSLIHRDDAARACLAALGRRGARIEVYNVTAPPVTMRAIVEQIASTLGRRLPPVTIPARWALGLARSAARWGVPPAAAGYEAVKKWLAHDVYDGRAFEEATSWRAQVTLSEGIYREVAWYLSRRIP